MADDARAPFEEFFRRYHRRLYGFAVSVYGRADADDLAQEAMVRAYASYARLDPARDPWPWLVAIVRNVARDRYARPAPLPLSYVPAAATDPADVEERAVVRAALRRLPARDRAVLVLREWHGLSFGELAGLLGHSPNTLRQQVLRARRRLADAYTAVGGRVLGVLAWPRWRAPVAGQLAAVVLTGVVVTSPPAREQPPPVAGPAAYGGMRTGPAVRRAAPERPLLPPRAARSGPARVERAVTRAPAVPRRPHAWPVARPASRPPGRVTNGPAGRTTTARDNGTPVVCAVAALC